MPHRATLVSLLALCVAALGVPAQAQRATGTIYGTVTDAETGDALPGVSVVVPGVVREKPAERDGPCWTPPRRRRRVRLDTTTGTDGRFRIENVPPGRYGVAAASGSHRRTEKSIIVEPGASQKLHFALAAREWKGPRPERSDAVYGRVVGPSGRPMRGVNVVVEGTENGTSTARDGQYEINGISPGLYTVRASFVGYEIQEKDVTVRSGEPLRVSFLMLRDEVGGQDVVVAGYSRPSQSQSAQSQSAQSQSAQSQSAQRRMKSSTQRMNAAPQAVGVAGAPANVRRRSGPWNTESYDRIEANDYKTAASTPLSTFSIDVDAASYANTRRMLCAGELPPKDAVRIEELINYFDYDYPQPEGNGGNAAPFSITTEVGAAPWNDAHRLVHVGLKGREIEGEAPPSSLVFLLDVSGSMRSPRKLPLLKRSFRRLTEQLGPQDRVAIVVYAGASGLVLDSTPGSEKEKIQAALRRLRAGGSTAGAAGIKLAYEVAQNNFIDGGNNRVILATDGDFNVGPSSDAEMTRLIEEKRESGVFLTTLGLGTGNLKDAKMEALADRGNGNYFYLDSPREANKVLGRELTSTLFTIAKDVKVQVEFNPAEVARYRLIGYVNRLLDKEDFADDSTDAGEMGAGHSVTALYEVVPAEGGPDADSDKSGLRYQTGRGLTGAARSSGELMQVRLRYKQPDGDTSRLLTRAVAADGDTADGDTADARSDDFAFSAAVAGFGMLLRDSKYRGRLTTGQVLSLAREGRGADPYGDRAEFAELVELFRKIEQPGRDAPSASRR